MERVISKWCASLVLLTALLLVAHLVHPHWLAPHDTAHVATAHHLPPYLTVLGQAAVETASCDVLEIAAPRVLSVPLMAVLLTVLATAPLPLGATNFMVLAEPRPPPTSRRRALLRVYRI